MVSVVNIPRWPVGILVYLVSLAPLSAIFEKEDFRFGYGFQSSLRYDSNVGRNDAEDSDWVFRFAPRADIAKPQGFIRGRFSLGFDVVRYQKASENDSVDANFGLNLEVGEVFGKDSPVQIKTEFRQVNDADGFTGEVTRRELYGIGIEARHRMGFGGGVSGLYQYEYLKSRTGGFSDLETTSGGFGIFYAPTAIFSINLRYRRDVSETKGTDNPIQSTTDRVTLGFQGRIAATVTGSLAVGIQERRTDQEAAERERSPSLEASLDWRYSSLMSFSLVGERRFGSDIRDRTLEAQSLALTGRRQLGKFWTTVATLRYEEVSFQGSASDPGSVEVQTVSFGLRRDIADWGNLGVAVATERARSDSDTFDYQALRLELQLSARF